MKTGVLGGSFNPVHIGHLVLAEEVRATLHLDRVLFVPAHQPPHKSAPEMPSGQHRLRMVQLAIEGNPHFEASDVELQRKGVSFTYHTMQALRELYPGDEFSFILGADSLPELPSWYRIRELAQLCKFAVGSRPGFTLNWEPLEKVLPSDTVMEMRHRVVLSTMIGVSSTEIRNRLSRNFTIKYLVPAAVEEYIRKHGLYKDLNHE